MKAGFVGLVGQPNSGKSSLLNALLKDKLSIVSSKPQTTRKRMLGIVNHGEDQIILVDSPGLVKAPKGLNAYLEKEAQEIIADVDVVAIVVSVDEKRVESIDEMIELTRDIHKPKVFIINKVDLKEFEHRVLTLRRMISMAFPDNPILEFSSQRKAEGESEMAEELFKTFLRYLPESPKALYDSEILTPQTTREIVTEFIREKCFLKLHQEVPYELAVKIEKFSDEDPGLTKIWADIWVARESHKGIVIGKGGALLKAIGTEARLELERFLGHKVFLSLNVVHKPDWFLKGALMKEIGYVHDRN